MSRKRERVMIIHDILKAIEEKKGSARPTHILYKSNLSSQMLKEYLGDLIDKKFIEITKDKKNNKFYTMTDRGYKYLQDFHIIKNFMESYDLTE
jgi:predicted transcriptional regulator